MTTQELTALAKELKLTPLRKRYCENLAVDPNHNQTRAMLAAGWIGAERTARIYAARIMVIPSVTKYLAALTAGAIERAEQKLENRLVDLGETLLILSDQARGTAWTERQVRGDTEVLRFDTHGAAESLLRYHAPTDEARQGGARQDRATQLWVSFLAKYPVIAREFHLFLLAHSTDRVMGAGSTS